MKLHTIYPDGRVADSEWKDDVDLSIHALKQAVGGNIEFVTVIFNGKPATMIVNEIGASTDPAVNPSGQLPANARATAIYWTATIRGITGQPFNPLEMPMVHGTVVLVEKDKRLL